MKFLTYFTAALLPALALGTPSPVRKGAELPNRIEERAPLNSDITSLLGNIIPDIQALTGLLQPEVINGIKTVVLGLAVVLSGDTPKQTKSLLSSANSLLSPELTKQILALLPSLTSLLTKESIDGLKTLLANAQSLLTKKFVDQTKGLINDVAPVSCYCRTHCSPRHVLTASAACFGSRASNYDSDLGRSRGLMMTKAVCMKWVRDGVRKSKGADVSLLMFMIGRSWRGLMRRDVGCT
jgi:hypothetical protein